MNSHDFERFHFVVDLIRSSTGSTITGYKLPEYFTNLQSWQENYGGKWSDHYYNDLAEFIGEELSWKWMPSNFRFLNNSEYREMLEGLENV